ncbi:MAG: hypothetical protein HQM13_19885 [SAR324 cluster bacterium]|nr:hypothetical protein [SAR324 cluster bacterium]
MVNETSPTPRSRQEHSAELKAIAWTFSSGSPKNVQEVLERLSCASVPRLQQIGLKELNKMAKNSPHASLEMKKIFETIHKRVGMFSVFSSDSYEAMRSLADGLSALGGKSLDSYGILELLRVVQANDQASVDIVEDLEELAKKVLIYYWKVFSHEDMNEIVRLNQRLKLASPDFLNDIKIWNLFAAAQKNPRIPQVIKKNLESQKNREKSARERKTSAEAEKRAQDDSIALAEKKPKSRRSGPGNRSLHGPDKQKLQEELDKIQGKILEFEKFEKETQALIPQCATEIATSCDKVEEEQKEQFSQRIITFGQNYCKLHGNPMAVAQKEKVKAMIMKYSTQMNSINGINLFTNLVAQLDDYNQKKTKNDSYEKRSLEIDRVLF